MKAIESALFAIEEYKMIKNGDNILVGVSGGPDSMCLLHILLEISKSRNLTIFVAHINHKIRGIEGDKDEIYVENFCKERDIPFYSKTFLVEKEARKRKISTETCGREIRYEYFEDLYKELSIDKVALAHNANDNGETILMRIMRGTGLDGLIGIKPVRDNIFIRPLIATGRKEIEEYCMLNKIEPRIDKTNNESIYRRNKIRLELIPYIEENFNSDIIKSLNKLANIVEGDYDYLNNLSEEKYKELCRFTEDKVYIDKSAFLLHISILTRIIRKAFFQVSGKNYNMEKIHVYDIIKLNTKKTGSRINLPEDIVVINNYKEVIFQVKEDKSTDSRIFNLNIGENYIEEIKTKIYIQLIKKGEELVENSNVKYFDYKKVSGDIVLRWRKDGDRFRPLGMKGEKKLKDFFIDNKVERDIRDKVPLICFGQDIAFVYNYRISDKFKISEDTKDILMIKIESEDK